MRACVCLCLCVSVTYLGEQMAGPIKTKFGTYVDRSGNGQAKPGNPVSKLYTY